MESQHMQCMEIWGGSRETCTGVEFGGLHAWVYSRPYGGATHGGDVYYASSCATGRISRLLLADVAGHGEVVAGTAADLRTLMRRFVNRLDQCEFVRLLNEQLMRLEKKGAFATAIVATFFAPTGRLTVCNAGHPRPLLWRNGQWGFLEGEGGNIPLGLLEVSRYSQFDVELRPGDRVLAYTDALIEARDLGEEGVLQIVSRLGNLAPGELTTQLLDEIGHPELAADDVTVLVISATGRAERIPFWKALAAMASQALHGHPVPLPDWTLANWGGVFFRRLEQRWRVG